MTDDIGYDDAVAGLEARGYGIKPGLERMEQLVRLLDNPQLTYPTLHVAGTNGKTSVAHMLGAILAAHGLKTGIYISPHLESVRERFILSGLREGKLGSDLISREEFAGVMSYLAPFVELIEGRGGEEASISDPAAVTYFELSTLAAFEWMAEKAVAAGVYEAGMGGRWDATNLVESQVAVLTSIGLDHVEYLGSNPVEQAAEKAGIIKMGAEVVSGPQPPEVLEVIERTSVSREAELALFGRDFRVEVDEPGVAGRVVTVVTPRAAYRDLYLPLFGPHQAQNLSVAIAAAEAFRQQPLEEAALRLAAESVRMPGRLEVVGRKPLMILDGAHNESAARALAAAIKESFSSLSVTMVLTVFRDKDAASIFGHLAPLANRLILTRSSSPRAADPGELAALVSAEAARPSIVEPLEKALDEAVSSTPEEGMVLVSGSLYGVGQARTHLLPPSSR